MTDSRLNLPLTVDSVACVTAVRSLVLLLLPFTSSYVVIPNGLIEPIAQHIFGRGDIIPWTGQWERANEKRFLGLANHGNTIRLPCAQAGLLEDLLAQLRAEVELTIRTPYTPPNLYGELTRLVAFVDDLLDELEQLAEVRDTGPIRHRKRGNILMPDHSDTERAGIFSCRTIQTQEAWVYSHAGPIRHRKRGYILMPDQSDAGSAGWSILISKK
eukprot:1179199-Prorocentrum_minimum.AAC.2